MTFGTVAASAVIGSFTSVVGTASSAQGTAAYSTGYNGTARYVRAFLSVVGTASMPASASFILGHPHVSPPT